MDGSVLDSCPKCGNTFDYGTTICPECGWGDPLVYYGQRRKAMEAAERRRSADLEKDKQFLVGAALILCILFGLTILAAVSFLVAGGIGELLGVSETARTTFGLVGSALACLTSITYVALRARGAAKLRARAAAAKANKFRCRRYSFTTDALYCPLAENDKSVRGIWFRERQSAAASAKRRMVIANLQNSGFAVSDSDYYEVCVQGGGGIEELASDVGGGVILWFPSAKRLV